jgi:PAS domain-containing protein
MDHVQEPARRGPRDHGCWRLPDAAFQRLQSGALLVIDANLLVLVAEGPGHAPLGVQRDATPNRTLRELLGSRAMTSISPHLQAVLDGDERMLLLSDVDGNVVRRLSLMARRDDRGCVVGAVLSAWSVAGDAAAPEVDRRYRLLAESANDVVSLRDRNGVFRYVSPSEDVVETEYRIVCRDRSIVWAPTAGRALRDPVSGELTEVRTTTHDVTERRAREAELRATTAELKLRLRETAAIAELGEHALEEPALADQLPPHDRSGGSSGTEPHVGAGVGSRAADRDPLGPRRRAPRVLAGRPHVPRRGGKRPARRDRSSPRRGDGTTRGAPRRADGAAEPAAATDRLDHALARSARSSERHAVLFLDVDQFKLVNDSLGHDAGDRLLCSLGPRLRAAVRPGDTVARFGGDEFVVLCLRPDHLSVILTA